MPQGSAILFLVALAAACAPPRGGPGGRGMTGPEPVEAVSVNPPGVPGLEGFSQAVRVGRTLYLSGQVALDSAGRVVGSGDLAAQTRQALGNLIQVVRAARGLPADVAKLTVYVVNYEPAQFRTIREASRDFFPAGTVPALTLVGVERLPEPGLLVSIDGVAVLRGLFADRERDRPPAAGPVAGRVP
jgi:enamine deaminase RidA (YjgF/YER057c/UK114 family)